MAIIIGCKGWVYLDKKTDLKILKYLLYKIDPVI